MRKPSLVLTAIVMFFAVNALAAEPCVNPKVTPAELSTWKVVKTDFGRNGQAIRTVVNPNPEAEIKASLYVYTQWMEKDPAGNYVIMKGIVKYCYLDNGKFRDFFLCRTCKCWHEVDTSQWPKENIDAMVKRLMKALDGKII